jgi:hypothetical protein
MLPNKDGLTMHDFLFSCKEYTGNCGGVRAKVTLKLGWLTEHVHDTVHCDGPGWAEGFEIDEADEQEAGYSDSSEDEYKAWQPRLSRHAFAIGERFMMTPS